METQPVSTRKGKETTIIGAPKITYRCAGTYRMSFSHGSGVNVIVLYITYSICFFIAEQNSNDGGI